MLCCLGIFLFYIFFNLKKNHGQKCQLFIALLHVAVTCFINRFDIHFTQFYGLHIFTQSESLPAKSVSNKINNKSYNLVQNALKLFICLHTNCCQNRFLSSASAQTRKLYLF